MKNKITGKLLVLIISICILQVVFFAFYCIVSKEKSHGKNC